MGTDVPDHCVTTAPDICAACKASHFNYGDGLDAGRAVALAVQRRAA
jgi:hypothetical protein